jgi:hypothetical protein
MCIFLSCVGTFLIIKLLVWLFRGIIDFIISIFRDDL